MLRTASRHAVVALALAFAGAAALVDGAVASPPTIQCPSSRATYENGGLQFVVTASDPDGQPLTLSVVSLPRRAEFDPPSGLFSWVPDYNQAGEHDVGFRAVAGGETTTCTVPISVANFNRPPRLTCPGPADAVQGDTIRIQFAATDPDGDALTFSATSLPAGASLSASGAFLCVTSEIPIGNYPIGIRVSDGPSFSACTLTLRVFGNVPSPTVTCPGPRGVAEASLLTFVIGVSDPSGHAVAVTASDLPAGATFQSATRTFSWTPTLAQAGTYRPRFTASNGLSPSVACTVLVTVSEVSVPPPVLACFSAISVLELQNLSFQVSATDPQGRPISYSSGPLPAGATFSSLGQFGWTPTIGQAGTYDLELRASNGGAIGTCLQRIVVEPRTIQPPTLACPPSQTGPERIPMSFTLSATDPQSLPLTYSAENLPAGATFNPVLRRFDWTPGFDQIGPFFPRFRVASVYAASICTVLVTVTARPPSGPTVVCPGAVWTSEGRFTSFAVSASDPENDPLTWFIRGLPAGSNFDPSVRRFTWTPSFAAAGIHVIEFVVSDGEVRDSCKVTVEVESHDGTLDNLEPVVVSVDDVRADQGGWVRLRVVAAPLDQAPNPTVTGYNLWRRVALPPPAAPVIVESASATSPPEAEPGADGAFAVGSLLPARMAALGVFPPGSWEAVSFTAATQQLSMQLLAPTRADSSAAGLPLEVFVVTGHFTQPGSWFASAPDSGYSVDDLAPAAPELRVTATTLAEPVRLAWSASEDLDLDGYEVHRGEVEAFVPDAGSLLATTAATEWDDRAPIAGAWYRVVARDLHGNRNASAVVPGPAGMDPVPGVVQLLPPRPSPTRGRLELVFDLPAARRVLVRVFDSRGRRIRTVLDGERPAGRETLVWDGRDDAGRELTPGIYLVQLDVAGDVRTRKFVRLESGTTPGR